MAAGETSAKRGAFLRRVVGRRKNLADTVREGVYIASAATRLALKNRILVETIAGGEEFDADHFIPHARATLLALADESAADAQRAAQERRIARRRFSDSSGTHDYRSRDSRNLRRRARQAEQIAAALRENAQDEDVLRELVEAARSVAWAEVARNIDSTLRIEAARPDLEPDYEQMRAARMQSLRLVDLPRLASHRRHAERLLAGESVPLEDFGSPGEAASGS